MPDRIARAQSLFYVGLFIMLGTAIGSATLEAVGGSGVLICLSLAGAVTAGVARIRLSRLQQRVRRQEPRFGTWATR